MARKVSEEKYQKTFSYQFGRWLEGTKDPFMGEVEMRRQSPFSESEEAKERREKDEKLMKTRVYDLGNNFEMRIFQRLYKVFSVLFCIFLVAMLLVAVSDLPVFGHAENPVNNEVAERYIEKGLEETGAVNIVTGQPYTPNGSEMSTPFSGDRAYTVPTSETKVNGSAAALESIVLTDDSGNGYTYYKLRDLGTALGFTVDWSAEQGVFIQTN